MSGSLGDSLLKLLPQWAGGTWAGPATSTAAATPQMAMNYTDAAAAMNPALVGQAGAAAAMPSQATNIAAGINPNWSSAMPAAGGDALAGALKGLSGQMGGQQQQPQMARAQAPGPTQSQIGRPSHAESLSSLLNQLNQWRSAYMSPQAINPASATSNTQQRQPGLLGM